jgi:hypothetical protein
MQVIAKSLLSIWLIITVRKIGFSKSQFYPCFLHILNLACQAALAVYDPTRKDISRKAAKVVLLQDDRSDYSGSEDSDDPADPDFDDEDPDLDEDYLNEELINVPSTSSTVFKSIYYI